MARPGYWNAVLSDQGKPILATITVYLAGTATKASLYTERLGGMAKDNPFQTDSLGRFQFFAAPGWYDIEISGTGITTYKMENILLGADGFYRARGYRSGDQDSLPGSQYTQIALNAESFDVGDFFNTTSGAFTIPHAGKYLVTAQIRLEAGSYTAGKRFLMEVRKGSTPILLGELTSSDNTVYLTINVSDIIALAQNDLVRLYVWHNDSTIDIYGADALSTYMTVEFIGAD